jgi:lysophospholipase L1-like esterase
MSMISKTMRLLIASAIGLLLSAERPARDQLWTEAFEASPAAYDVGAAFQNLTGNTFRDHPVEGTVRYTLVVSAGGTAVRVRLSNEEGAQPLRIGAASVAVAGADPATTRGAVQRLTFGGAASITAPPGAAVLSDPVDLRTAPMDRLALSIYLQQPITLSPLGGGSLWVTAGDQTGAARLTDMHVVRGRPLVSGVIVANANSQPVVVAFGDSITDGIRDTENVLHGYPEQLARRFAELSARQRRSVVNAGIGGNRVLTTGWGNNALARLDRDALRIEGLTHIILLEGINDIGMSGTTPFGSSPVVSAQDLIAGYQQIIARAHARGVKVLGGTLTPFQGCFYFSADKEAVRQAVNQWIRNSGAFDGVIDFDAALRDPNNSLRLRAAFDSGDHLHPSEAGYRAMGDSIDLRIFR